MPYDLDPRQALPGIGLRAAVVELMSRSGPELSERELRAALRALVVATRDRACVLRDAYGAGQRDDPRGRVFARYAD